MSTTSPSTSTVSSQSTVFEDPVLEKVFLAGCQKNFVGNGPRKLSKAEIKKLNVADLADLVSRKTSHARFSLAITDYLGLCRIYQKVVIFIQEDIVKLNDEFNCVLYSDDSGLSSKNKKGKKKRKDLEDREVRKVGEGTGGREIDVESIQSRQLDDHDFVSIFSRKLQTDQHLRVEIDDYFPQEDTLGYFGDEIHLQRGGSEESIRDIHMDPLGPEPLISNELIDEAGAHQFPDGSVKSTPKRKNRTDHDQTPQKRQKKSPGSDGKSTASRRLFPQDEPSTSMPPHETVLHPNVDQNGEEPFEHMPFQDLQEKPRRSSTQINVPGVEDLEPNLQTEQVPASPRQGPVLPEIIEPSHVGEQSTRTDVSLPNVQHQTDAYTEDSDDMQLEVLDDETITALTPKRRRRLKKVFDEERRISLEIDIHHIGKFSKLHTRKMETTLFYNNSKKKSLRNLFALPATSLKRAWGNTLQNLYSEMARPILHPSHVEMARDFYVDKRQRFSSFRRKPGSGPTVPFTPEDQNITGGGIGDNTANSDRELMPPPMLPRPSDERQKPRTPGRSHNDPYKPPSLPPSPQQQSAGQRSPHTPTRPIQPGTSAASPKTPGFNQPLLVPEIMQPALPGDDYADLPDPAQMSPSTASSKERSFLMKDFEFYKFLEELWVIRMYKVDLDHVINPQRSTLTTFYRYFNYLQSFQVKRKLTMTQEIIYGPVHILKGTEEQRE